MTEDWAAVSNAINQRMVELGLSQRELIARSQVSKSMIREIRHNTVQRRRSDRTLEALSLALEWHPNHLAAVLVGRRPPAVGEPVVRADDDVPGRLAVIEQQLREITARLGDISAITDRLDAIHKDVETIAKDIHSEGERRAN